MPREVLMFLMTIFLLAAVAYVHYRLPSHSGNTRQLWAARAVLLTTGTAFGSVMAWVYADAGATVLVFLSGFGLTHVPTAGILFLKKLKKQQDDGVS